MYCRMLPQFLREQCFDLKVSVTAVTFLRHKETRGRCWWRWVQSGRQDYSWMIRESQGDMVNSYSLEYSQSFSPCKTLRTTRMFSFHIIQLQSESRPAWCNWSVLLKASTLLSSCLSLSTPHWLMGQSCVGGFRWRRRACKNYLQKQDTPLSDISQISLVSTLKTKEIFPSIVSVPDSEFLSLSYSEVILWLHDGFLGLGSRCGVKQEPVSYVPALCLGNALRMKIDHFFTAVLLRNVQWWQSLPLFYQKYHLFILFEKMEV